MIQLLKSAILCLSCYNIYTQIIKQSVLKPASPGITLTQVFYHHNLQRESFIIKRHIYLLTFYNTQKV